jgi:hypothetical protein
MSIISIEQSQNIQLFMKWRASGNPQAPVQCVWVAAAPQANGHTPEEAAVIEPTEPPLARRLWFEEANFLRNLANAA